MTCDEIESALAKYVVLHRNFGAYTFNLRASADLPLSNCCAMHITLDHVSVKDQVRGDDFWMSGLKARLADESMLEISESLVEAVLDKYYEVCNTEPLSTPKQGTVGVPVDLDHIPLTIDHVARPTGKPEDFIFDLIAYKTMATVAAQYMLQDASATVMVSASLPHAPAEGYDGTVMTFEVMGAYLKDSRRVLLADLVKRENKIDAFRLISACVSEMTRVKQA